MKEILSYFVRNPRAADSLEGVARWRLMEEQVRRTLQQTEAALGFLVARGFLEEIQAAGCSRLFRLDARHAANAASFLAEHGERQGKEEL